MATMICQVCNVELRLAERQGVEIDYYPQCRGVWLDRGELEKLIERSAVPFENEGYGRSNHDREDRGDRHGGGDRHGNWDKHENRDQGERRRSSFLGDLFDF